MGCLLLVALGFVWFCSVFLEVVGCAASVQDVASRAMGQKEKPSSGTTGGLVYVFFLSPRVFY